MTQTFWKYVTHRQGAMACPSSSTSTLMSARLESPRPVRQLAPTVPHEGSLRRQPHGRYDGTIIFDGKEIQFRSIKD